MSVSRNRWLVVGAAATAIFMAMLDASIVNVALPVISRDLGVGPDQSQWVVLGYLLAVAAIVLPAGQWLGSVGQRSALSFAVTGFALSSTAAVWAPGFGWLLAARVVQGAFGAVILALVPALVAGAVAADERGRAIGVVATVGPLGSVCGPALGGLLVSACGWRSIFLVNLPVCAALLDLVFASMDRDERVRAPTRSWLVQPAVLGAAVLAAMIAFDQASTGSVAWLALLPPGGVLATVWSRHRDSRPVVSVLKRPAIGHALAALTLIAAATAAVQFLAPFYLEQVLALSPATTGLVVLAFPAAMATCGLIAGAIVDRVGSAPVAVAGALVLIVGLALTTRLSPDWGPLDLAWRLAVVGTGLGLFNGPNQTAILTAAEARERATASAASGLARSLAFAGGPLLATSAWAMCGYQPAGMRIGIGLGLALCAFAALLVAGAVRGKRSDPSTVAATAAAH